MGGVKKQRRPILARGSGAVTHNMASEPGEFEITVWGKRKGKKRPFCIRLGEADVQHLIQKLRDYDLLR